MGDQAVQRPYLNREKVGSHDTSPVRLQKHRPRRALTTPWGGFDAFSLEENHDRIGDAAFVSQEGRERDRMIGVG